MTTRRPPRKRAPRQVSVRAETFEALRVRATRQGTQVGKLLDEILTAYLDAQERTS